MNRGKKSLNLLYRLVFKLLSWFVLVYGITGSLFYLFFILFPLSVNGNNPHLGFETLGFTALIMLKVVFMLLYGGIVYSGVMLLKKNKSGLIAYFVLFFLYNLITFTYSGSMDVYLFLVQLVYGFVLLWLFSGLKRVRNAENRG